MTMMSSDFTQVTNTYKILKELVEELEEYSTALNNRCLDTIPEQVGRNQILH